MMKVERESIKDITEREEGEKHQVYYVPPAEGRLQSILPQCVLLSLTPTHSVNKTVIT